MIVLDMDGVLADFSAAACTVHGRPGYQVNRWNFFEDWGISVNEFWKKIHALGDEFYAGVVQPYPWKDELLETIERAGEFVIMSSPSNAPCGYAAKKIWCDKHAPGAKIIVGSEKHLLAGHNRVLVDDYESNLDKFRAYGGDAIAFPQPWNHARAQCGHRIEYVEGMLSWMDTGKLGAVA